MSGFCQICPSFSDNLGYPQFVLTYETILVV